MRNGQRSSDMSSMPQIELVCLGRALDAMNGLVWGAIEMPHVKVPTPTNALNSYYLHTLKWSSRCVNHSKIIGLIVRQIYLTLGPRLCHRLAGGYKMQK